MKILKKKKAQSDEELLSLLLDEILDDRARRIWERIKDK
jgi:hypothetical protein